MFKKPLTQCWAIMLKNFANHSVHKKKLFGEFIFPIIISLLYILMQNQKQQNPLLGVIFQVLLKMYIAMIGMSATKELVTLFLNEREQKFRQYQVIFGLGTRCHTLSNLLYMGLYMSVFLVPFYLTLNYFKFQWHYVGMFAAFVISSLTCSMMLTSFFTDHKLATELIGMLFSLSSFLALLYSGGTSDQNGNIVYNTVDYIAMFFPNSSFSIAIMYNNPKVSLYSLSIVKIYMITYSIMQFPHQWKELLQSCKNRLKKCFNTQTQQNILTEEFNLSDQISDNQHSGNPQSFDQKNVMIQITNLVKTYKIKQGQFNALNKINLTVNKRQIFGLLGRNGAGKTTLVDILTDVSGSTSGNVFINYEKQKDEDLQKIGICYQHEILYEELTVEQHLYFYCRIKNVKTEYKETIDSIVNMLRIRDEFHKKIKQLSGGNKRKVSIAIAVLGTPELMIFDEPTSGLDPLSRRSVWEILTQLKKEFNSSIILTTHHLDEAEVLSDWICVIEKGGVIVQNSPDQIKGKYGNGYYLTMEFSSSEHLQKTLPAVVNHLEHSLKRVQVIENENNRAKLFLKFTSVMFQSIDKLSSSKDQSDEELLLSVLKWLDNLDGVEIQIEKNSLEQSFIAILKDPQNGIAINSSGDSIELSNVLQRPPRHRINVDDENESIIDSISLFLKQVKGVFLRCIYFHKGQTLRFFLTYNANIIIFVFAMLFNKFIYSLIEDSKTNEGSSLDISSLTAGGDSSKKQDYSNNMLILQGYIIMAGAFIAIPIYEKEKNIRRVFNSRGVRPLAYWMGNFLFDFAYYLLNLFILRTFISPQSFAFLQQAGEDISVFVFLGVGIIIYTYTISNLFSKVSTANTWFSIINMLFGFILLPMIILGKETFLGYFSFIKYLYPYYDINIIIMNQTLGSAGGMIINSNLSMEKESASYIWFCIVIYLTILVLVEIRVWDRVKEKVWFRIRVEKNQHRIELKAVYKQYGDLQALKNVNYHVNNERLALLGHNGAGKSTTFGLLSGQINPTCGELFLENKTKLNHQKIMKSAGICYQQDSLWESMTPLEILNVFSYLVPIQHSGKETEWLLQSLQFESLNFNKRFENLSGGNKRKICMAVALYGDPYIRLLDECSTGLDPNSRVAMVQTIKHSRQGSTIFTTHSMSEAENLCSKTVIMRKGEVLEFDYIYKLKEKHYNCYWIDMAFKSQLGVNVEEGDSFVESNIELIKQQLKKILSMFSDKVKDIKNVNNNNKLPKLLKPTNENKIRMQFEKLTWPIHIALKAAYLLRNKLESLKQQSLFEAVYISQPKLEDIYIKLTKQYAQQGEQSYSGQHKEYFLDGGFEQQYKEKRQQQEESQKSLFKKHTSQPQAKQIQLISI